VIYTIRISGKISIHDLSDSYEGYSSFPPPKILTEIGISFEIVQELGMLNDDGCSFREIADHIEKHL
jgi:hypothetical protein